MMISGKGELQFYQRNLVTTPLPNSKVILWLFVCFPVMRTRFSRGIAGPEIMAGSQAATQ